MTIALPNIPRVKDSLDLEKHKFMLDVVAHTYSLSTQEVEAEGLQIQGQMVYISKF